MMHENVEFPARGSVGKPRFFDYVLWTFALWPMVCLVIVGLVWVLAFSKISSEKAAIGEQSLALASSLSRSYADQAERSVIQIDQMLRILQYYWRYTNGRLQLRDQKLQGVFPDIAGMKMTVIDRNGRPVTSTLPLSVDSPWITDRPHFLHHKQSASSDVLITGPVAGLTSGRPALLFSKRMETSEGNFDGVVVVAVEPSYLNAFTDPSALGTMEFLELRRLDGTLIVAKSTVAALNEVSSFRALPAFDPSPGAISLGATAFADRQPRVIGWTPVNGQPLLAIAGIGGVEGSALLNARAREYRAAAVAASLALLVMALAGLLLQSRRAYQSFYRAEIDNAYRMATDNANEGFYMLRPVYKGSKGNQEIVDFLIEDCNENGASYYGTTRQEAMGKLMSKYFKDGYAENILPTYCKAMEIGFVEAEFRPTRHSTLRPQWVHRRIFRSGNSLAVTVRDISEKKANESDLLRLANVDPVTSLPNRHWLLQNMPMLLEKAKSSNLQIALLFVDLDDFKMVNDTLGHAAGDMLLNLVGARLKTAIRPEDTAVRLGGDEFTLVLDQVGSEDDVVLCADRIVTALSHPFALAGTSTHLVHASIGISLFPRDGEDLDTLLKHADIAMYAVKAGGKRNVQFFRPELAETLLEKVAGLKAIERAIANDEFILHFQPRVDAHTGALRSMEALIRWNDPQRGMVAPGDFIPLAEASGLVSALGELVIRKTCEHLAQWKAQGLALVPVSINVSPRQLGHGKVHEQLANYLQEYGLERSLLEIEITESAMLAEGTEVAQELAAIESLGISMVVDDFGTGYSSLSQLKRLKVNSLKVDQSFTATLEGNPEDEAVFRAILSMAHTLNIAVVAEGVETLGQLRILQNLCCDEVQGFYISRPVPPAEVPGLLTRVMLFPQHGPEG